MTTNEFIRKMYDTCIVLEDGYFYVLPTFKIEMIRNGMSPTAIKETKCSWEDIKTMLELETRRRNEKINPMRSISKWIMENIVDILQAEKEEQESDFIKNIIDYLKLNDELKQKQTDLEQKEEIFEKKKKIAIDLPAGISFSKNGKE